MSLRPQVIYLVPEETARVAHAAFPKGNLYLRMYDALGSIFADRQFKGRPGRGGVAGQRSRRPKNPPTWGDHSAP